MDPANSNQRKKIVIVGGVAGGMSAAARARRLCEGSEIVVLERGGFVSFANCGLPYYLGGEITRRESLLVQTPQSLKDRFNLDVRTHQEVLAIDAESRFVTVKDRINDRLYRESYDDLLLAVGAAPVVPDLPGIKLPGIFTLRSLEDADQIKLWIENEGVRNAVIAGAGFIGLEMAEQLARQKIQVTVVEGLDQVLAPVDPEMAALVHEELRRHGIKLVLSSFIKKFSAAAEVECNGAVPRSCWLWAGDHPAIAADLVILGLGIRPELTLARQCGLAESVPRTPS